MICRITFIIFLCVLSNNAVAIKTIGRIVLGTTAVTERYNTTEFGSASNDMLVASSRYYYKMSELGDDQWELVSDFRDKYDFFGKLNKTQLQLEAKNEFQTRQLSARWVNPAGALSAQMGRFQAVDVGAVFLDGLSLDYKINNEWKTGLIGGFNPKSTEQSYLEYNSKATQYGVFLYYQTKERNWIENQFLNLAFVNQIYNGLTERSFLYNNIVYQWNSESRLINTIYYDFVPTAKIQTLNFLYQQKITDSLTSDINLLHIDVIEYKRNQNVLEKLAASPYDEAKLQFDFKIHGGDNVGLQLISGKRKIDNLTKTEINLAYDLNNFISKSVDVKTLVGSRKNFTSTDVYFKFGIGYFDKNWEFYFDNQLAQNKNDDGTKTQPITTELGATSYYSKQLYFNASMQRSADENVNIFSTYLRAGYRFGNQEIPAVRDGAPPRGAF